MTMATMDSHNSVIISFIITDYNIPIPLLRECIESILSLEIKVEEREIILVDDGSEISPESEIKDFSPQITYIRQENQGLSVARNVGIDASQGKYIQFVDGDDCLLPNYKDCFESIVKNDSDMLFFGLSNQKTTLFPGKTKIIGTGVQHMLVNNLKASACGYIFRKELLADKLRFTKGILHEDEEFTPLLTLNAKNVAQYDGAAYYYRERENSIVHSESPEHVKRRFNDFIGIILRLKEKTSSLQGDARKALSRRVNQLSMDYIFNAMTIMKDETDLDSAMKKLEENKLIPLPVQTYTMKYFAFSVLTHSRLGWAMLTKYLRR